MSSGFLLSGLGFPHVRIGGAEYDPYDSEDSTEPSKGLKPVRYAQSIRVKSLARAAWRLEFHWGKRYLPVLFDSKAMRKFLLKDADDLFDAEGRLIPVPRIPPTHLSKLPNMRLLCTWNVMREKLPHEWFIVHGSYFEIPKKDGWERTIIDLRPLNELCKTSPRLCLADIRNLLMDVLMLGADGKGVWMSTGDFMNFYHQLKLPTDSQNLFAVRCGNTIFFMTVLPMGASCSCFLAQLVTWTIILIRAPTDTDTLGVDGRQFGIDIPPGIVHMENQEGLLNAQYDNVFVCTKSHFLAEKWVKRIKGNAKHVNAHWGDDDVLCAPQRTANHLGVHIDGTSYPKWRHIASKVESWDRWFKKPRLFYTPRWVAKIVGISCRDATIRLRPLFEIDHVIDGIRFVHDVCTLRRKKDWYQCIQLPTELLAILRGHMLIVLRNEWHEEPIPQKSVHTFVAASDASEFGTGYVILRGQRGDYLHDSDANDFQPGSCLPRELVGVHIYILELYAAWRLVQKVATLTNGEPSTLTLIMDNTAAKSAIEKWYSSNKEALKIIRRIRWAANRANLTLKIIWIASGDNPADEPSRRLSCHSSALWRTKCKKALDFADGKWGYAYSGRLRHEKLYDVPSGEESFLPPPPKYTPEGHDDNEINELVSNHGNQDNWSPEDDAASDDDVEENLLNELDSCYPKNVNHVTMREGFERLLSILDGEHCSSEQ